MRIACITIAALAVMPNGAPAQTPEKPVALKILYAGDLKSKRTEEFRSFLDSRFAKVGLADYLSLSAADTKGYDVIILDWPHMPPRENGELKHPALDRNYDRPTILIGGGTLGVGRHLELKIDDLCICLGDAAHAIRTDHEIFHKPFEIKIALQDRPTPPNYRGWPEGEHLGQTMKVWKVQERGWSLDRPLAALWLMPGMVSDPYGFADSPDAEVITGGLNMKSPEAVAIGRHGNFLLWGFYASPSDLTPEARKCLVNAICYIKKFDGQRPIVHKVRGQLSRQWAIVYAFAYRDVSDRQRFSETQLESVRKNPERRGELHHLTMEKYRDQFPEDVRRQLGSDPDRYVEYYRKNLEFLRPTGKPGFPFEVDEEVKGLGVSNRKHELLDQCVAMLERADRPELALRILRRYTTEDLSEARPWRSWLEANRRRLFFTDSGGYKFLVAPEPLGEKTSIRTNGAIPNAEQPTVAQAELSPTKVRPGGTLELVLKVKVASTWHIYAVGCPQGPGVHTTLKLTLPEGVEAEGEWNWPVPVRSLDGQMIYEGAIEFRRRLRVAKGAAYGPIDVSCDFGYQACDRFSCQLPTKVVLRASAGIVAKTIEGR